MSFLFVLGFCTAAFGLLCFVLPVNKAGISRLKGAGIGVLGLLVCALASPPDEHPESPHAAVAYQTSPSAAEAAAHPEITPFDPAVIYLEPSEERLRPILLRGANLVLKGGNCLEINDASIDPHKTTPRNPAFFYTCLVDRPKPFQYENFYLSKKEIDARVLVKLPKPVNKDAALDACTDAVRNRAQFPSSVTFHELLGTAVDQAGNGNVLVVLDFEAKNGFGGVLPYRARCTATTEGSFDVQISRR